MTDFYQTGVISTLHRLGKSDVDRLEKDLTAISRHVPIGLVLPSLYSELERPALQHIVDELRRVPYLNEIIVALGQADLEQFRLAKKFFSVLPHDVKVLWIHGERVQSLLKLLVQNNLDIGSEGKGRSTWIAYGYILARGKSKIITLHDCDILTYNREFLARLCYPTANPKMTYEFCKGFYARVTDRLYGRVTRLLVTPLIRTLQSLVGPHPFLIYLDSFRYPLAGEFSMITDLARLNRIPGDWGLEVGVLAEIYRNSSVNRVCQVELTDNYDHKHQELSPEDPQKGLLKMSIDITKSLLRNLAIEGIVFNEGIFHTLRTAYLRAAQNTIKRYEDDAIINGLFFDRHEERLAVEAFCRGIKIAGEDFLNDPLGIPLITNWNRVTSAVPDFFDRLLDAVDQDGKE